MNNMLFQKDPNKPYDSLELSSQTAGDMMDNDYTLADSEETFEDFYM